MALSEGERAELLGHLKAKWAQLNTAFQKLPFMVGGSQPASQRCWPAPVGWSVADWPGPRQADDCQTYSLPWSAHMIGVGGVLCWRQPRDTNGQGARCRCRHTQVDTPAKARRKEALEAQLAQCETDIKSLQHGSTVYVVLDQY
jgi:hypothetical protein